MNEIKKEKINYESIIAGALLKFESLDNVDISLLIEDFKSKTNTEVCGYWYYSFDNLETYIEILENGTLKLRRLASLDYFIEEENRTLRDKLLEVAGDTVCNYFSSFEMETFKQEKERALLENKDKVLNTANILLISDIQDDYDELVKYGFKNVDYFKSIIRADQYFAKHPEELEKYHIILMGHQSVREDYVSLVQKIGELKKNKHILETPLLRFDHSEHLKLVTYLGDDINRRSWHTRERTYPDIFDRIVENTLINHTLENVDLKEQKFVPIQDYMNPNRLPLPTKKSDLKILYLDSLKVSEYANRIANELGLHIDFKEDDNFSLDKYVKRNLGEYDIIIVTRLFSFSLLGMNHESTEQCKDTGRELTLFVAQDTMLDSSLGDNIKLEYVFGGNYAPDSLRHNQSFKLLIQEIAIEAKDEYWKKYFQKGYSHMKAIIEASVNFYNYALIEIGKKPISDLNFKTVDEFDKEYELVFENERKKKEAELAFIRLFDNIRYSIINYLNYRKNGFISQALESLKITEGEDGIKVENLYQGRTLCAIVFPKYYEQEDLRIFKIQTLTKKGTLSSPQTIGIYTSKYENFESIPNKPSEKEKNALVSIEKKINVALKPLNEEAQKKQLEQEAQEHAKRKKRTRRKH